MNRFQDLQRVAFDHAFARAEQLPRDLLRDVSAGWRVALSVNK